MRYLVVDAMMSGTGIRGAFQGGYLGLSELGLSPGLIDDFARWLAKYDLARSRQYGNTRENRRLDTAGIELCKRVMVEIPDSKVEYFSDAQCRNIPVDAGSQAL